MTSKSKTAKAVGTKRPAAGAKSDASKTPTVAAPAARGDIKRAGTKVAAVIGLLSRPGGASIDDLITATGWLPHTTRAALTGLRKRGFGIERRVGPDGKGSVYSIRPAPAAMETRTSVPPAKKSKASGTTQSSAAGR
jgi:Protein of unknown function (DUF3489)